MEKSQKLSWQRKVLRSLLVLLLIAAFFVIVFFILKATGAWEYINSVEKVKGLILGMGIWGRVIFVLLQFLQVTFIPLPSSVCVIAGTLVYGPLQAGLLSLAGILLGSVMAFGLGKIFGQKLVKFMVGEETSKKWINFLDNGKYGFIIMMLLPFFPDDVLCLVAGVTNMSWRFFVITQLITRPISIFTTAYMSSGTLIPYHGWGLIVWGIIAAVAIALIVLTTVYNEKIEKFITKTFSKKVKPADSDKKD